MENLFKSGCHIVFCSNEKQRKELIDKILNHDHNYKVEINEVFSAKKQIGPFTVKNKKTVGDIIFENKTIKKHSVEYGLGEMKKSGIHYIDCRACCALGDVQREIVTIFYEVLCGRDKILLADYKNSKEHFIKMVFWLNQMELFKNNNGSLIYITELSEDEFLNEVTTNGNIEFESLYFYQVKNNQLIKVELKDSRSKVIAYDIEIYELLDFIEVKFFLLKGKIKAGDKLLCLRNNTVIQTMGSISVYENEKEIIKDEVDESNTEFFYICVPIKYKNDFKVMDEFIKC